MNEPLQLPTELNERLETIVTNTGRSKTSHMLEALERYIEDQEDIYDAEQILADIRSGKETTVPWEEVRKNLELDY